MTATEGLREDEDLTASNSAGLEALEKASVADNYPLKVPSFKSRDLDYDYKNYIHDYVDLRQLGIAIEKARIALFMVTEETNKVTRLLAKLKIKKDRAWRRAFLDSNQRTDTLKRMWADLLTEDLEDEVLTAQQYIDELSREANALRIELQALQGIGNNIRQQVKS